MFSAIPLFYSNIMITHCWKERGRYITDDPLFAYTLQKKNNNNNIKKKMNKLTASVSLFIEIEIKRFREERGK